jgi:hypothetical protein
VARYVLTRDVTVPGSSYENPSRVLYRGQVVELSDAEVESVGQDSLRPVNANDQDGI